MASQQPGRRKAHVASRGQKEAVSFAEKPGDKPRVSRTIKAMTVMPMLKAMLTSNNSRTGMISDVLTLSSIYARLMPVQMGTSPTFANTYMVTDRSTTLFEPNHLVRSMA